MIISLNAILWKGQWTKKLKNIYNLKDGIIIRVHLFYNKSIFPLIYVCIYNLSYHEFGFFVGLLKKLQTKL